MKRLNFLFLPILCILISQCASYTLESNPPFQVVSSSYFTKVGGMPGSPNATEVKITYTAAKEVKFDSIFFRTQKAKTGSYVDNNKKTVRALFYESSANNNMNMHNDATKEFGNTPPVKTKKNPFDLKDNEIVISYIENNTIKYYKINNLQKGKAVIMQ